MAAILKVEAGVCGVAVQIFKFKMRRAFGCDRDLPEKSFPRPRVRM
jgi:hypothetical protein